MILPSYSYKWHHSQNKCGWKISYNKYSEATYVDEFLKEITNFFEIYVFTASMEEYTSLVIDLMNKNNIIKVKFFRQDCIFSDGLYIKDLFKVSNNLKNVIIIDIN